jgi:hypothetical protein
MTYRLIWVALTLANEVDPENWTGC